MLGGNRLPAGSVSCANRDRCTLNSQDGDLFDDASSCSFLPVANLRFWSLAAFTPSHSRSSELVIGLRSGDGDVAARQ